MHLSRSLFTLCLVGSTLASYKARSSEPPNPDEVAPIVTNRYIVEVAEGVNYDAAVKELKSRPGVRVLKELRSSIFSGISVEVLHHSPESLQEIPQVAQAWRSHQIKLMPNVEVTAFSDGLEPANYSVHAMTGVDKVHEAGIFGKGVTVAIVDTGIDYNHPALGGGIGPGFKVAGGYDFVGDGAWPDADKAPDSDPIDQIGHGTHVAGIVAGKNDWYTGVAPEATILSYKVFTANDYTDDETLIDAFTTAYEAGADVITASIGEDDGWSTGAWATVASRLVDEGVVVTIAAGNSGEEGPFRASSGSSGENVLAIASVDPSTILAIPIIATFDGQDTEANKIAYRPGPYLFPTTITNASVYPLSLDPTIEDDACLPLPPDTPDLSDKIVLVRISTQCWDDQQTSNLVPYNPLGIIFYHNEEKEYSDPWTMDSVFVGIITPEAGVAMVETIAAGGSVTLDFSEIDGYVNMPYSGGGMGSYFTSWGATWDLQLKPDVAAPGALITSTYPTWMGSWATMSGTSMATPYVAGVAALYISKFGGRTVHGKGFAKMLHSRITASGAAMQWPGNVADGGQHLASPTQVGTGLIDAYKILNYTTQLSLARFQLNDTHQFSRYQNVDITNNGNEEVIYTFTVQDAGGYDAFETEKSQQAWAPVMNDLRGVRMYKLKPEVRFPAGTFRVKPGQTKKAEFIFTMPTLPEGRRGADMPIVSGKILITGSNGEQVSVAYFGVVGDLKKEFRQSKMYWTGLGWPRISTNSGPGPILDVWQKPYWGFDMSTTSQDYPMLQTALVYGAREIRWDIYEPGWRERNWQYPPVPGENGYVGSATFWRYSQRTWFDPETEDVNDVIAMPDEYLNRQFLHCYMWFGKLANGTQIAPGNYTMRVATLLPFGNRYASDNWDVASTPEVMILPPKAK